MAIKVEEFKAMKLQMDRLSREAGLEQPHPDP